MNASRSRCSLICGALALACLPAAAHNMGISAADIALGDPVAGPPVSTQDLEGRVVVLEFWGIHCPPCLASMPKLETLHQELGPQGLVVIGAHAQGGTAEEVRRAATELGTTFPIVARATVKDGMDFEGIPHCMVFDHTGKCVYRGAPGEAADVIAAAVHDAPAGVLGGRALDKLAPLAETLKQEEAWGPTLRRVRGLAGSKDGDTAEEARFVVAKLEARGHEMLDGARDLAAADPVAATLLAQRCSNAFKGDQIGRDAGKQLAAWRKDRAFQAAVQAGQQLARLEALRAAVARSPDGVPPEVTHEAREIARRIQKGAPDSAYAATAAEIVAALAPGE